MGDTHLLDVLLDLERLGWDSLCDGTGSDFYGSLMTRDGVMVLSNGMILDRTAVVQSLRTAPAWLEYKLSDARVVGVGAEGAALVYTARAYREADEPPFLALMSSVYRHTGAGWRLALYQQTLVPAEE